MKFTASASATLLLAAVLATVALSRRTVDQEVMDLAAVLTNDVRQLEEDRCAKNLGICSQYPCDRFREFNANPDAKCTAKRRNLVTNEWEDAPISYCCVKNNDRCDITKCKESCAEGTEDPGKFCGGALTCCKRKSVTTVRAASKDLKDTCPVTCSPPTTAACPAGKIDYTQVKGNGNYCQKSHGVCCVDSCEDGTLHVFSGDSKKYTITGCRRSGCQAAELTADELFCRNGLQCCMKEMTEEKVSQENELKRNNQAAASLPQQNAPVSDSNREQNVRSQVLQEIGCMSVAGRFRPFGSTGKVFTRRYANFMALVQVAMSKKESFLTEFKPLLKSTFNLPHYENRFCTDGKKLRIIMNDGEIEEFTSSSSLDDNAATRLFKDLKANTGTDKAFTFDNYARLVQERDVEDRKELYYEQGTTGNIVSITLGSWEKKSK